MAPAVNNSSISIANPLSSPNEQIFKDKTVYVRVVEVTGNAKEPLLLENDDVLMPRDMVCLLDEIPVGSPTNSDTYEASGKKGLKNIFVEGKGGYVKGSGSSRPIKEYKMKVGKIDYVVSVMCHDLSLSFYSCSCSCSCDDATDFRITSVGICFSVIVAYPLLSSYLLSFLPSVGSSVAVQGSAARCTIDGGICRSICIHYDQQQ